MKIVNIGRDGSNEIVVNDPTVTRLAHCQIIQNDQGGYTIVDCSTNGTFVNGARIPKAIEVPLNVTDFVRIGNTTLQWHNYFKNNAPETQIGDNTPETRFNEPDNTVQTQTEPIAPATDGAVEKMSLFGYWLKCFKKYADFGGRARRKEYWGYALFNFLFTLPLQILVMYISIQTALYGPYVPTWFMIVRILYYLIVLGVFLPGLGVFVRRMHDIGKSGWALLIALIPFVGGIWMLVLLCLDSQQGENKYGPNPKGV